MGEVLRRLMIERLTRGARRNAAFADDWRSASDDWRSASDDWRSASDDWRSASDDWRAVVPPERFYGAPYRDGASLAAESRRRPAVRTPSREDDGIVRTSDPVRRGALLPFTRNMRTGETDLAWPQFLLDMRDAVRLPRDVYTGRVDPASRDGMMRTLGLAGMATGGGAFAPKPANAIAMGMQRVPLHKRRTSSPRDFAEEIDRVLKTGQSSRGKLFREDLGEITIDMGVPGNAARNFKGGWGLDHIRWKRTFTDGIDGDTFVRRIMPRILSKGRVVRLFGLPRSRGAEIDYGDYKATLRLHRFGDRETWLLSGFEKWK